MTGPRALPPQPPVDLPATSSHGTHNAYQAHGCRCGECQEFRRAYQRQNAALRLRLDRVPDGVPHGKPSTYNYYRCRCEDCCEARRSYDRDRWEIKNRTAEYRNRKEQQS